MLAIRLKRTGRSGHAQFRLVVQDSHFHPTRGRVVAYLGSYNPHTKTIQLDKELADKYLSNGAQPSDRAARILQSEGIKLPDWVKLSDPKNRAIRNPEKLRRNRPEEPAPAETTEAPASEAETPEATDAQADDAVEAPAAEPETPAEEATAEETPAEPETPAESPASE